MPGPRQPLLDATISQVGTEEKYQVAAESQEVVKVLRLVANALESGQLQLKHSFSGATVTRECKFKDDGAPVEAELGVHVYLLSDVNFVLGGVKMAKAEPVPEPELQDASSVGTLPTR